MKWLEETRGRNFELIRHFLARMFDSEMFSTRGQWWTVAASALGLAIPAGLLLVDPPYLLRAVTRSPEALRAVAISDRLALLTLIFAVTGILALLAWQSLFPSRRDYLALAGLPVRPRQIFAARFISVALMATAISLAMSVLPSLIAPHQLTANAGEMPALANIAARAASSSLGCLFVFFAMVALQGIVLNLLPGGWSTRVSGYLQGALLAVFFLAGLYSWFIVDWRQETIARLPGFGAWAPPVWFTGLHQAMTGDRDPFFAAMAERALMAAAASVLLAALMYAIAYSRHRTLLLESPDRIARPTPRSWSFLRLFARDPRRLAVMEFMAQVLSRSRMHRMVVLAYLGAGVAIMINSVLLAGLARKWSGGWPEILRFSVLYWPVGLGFIILAGVRHAFSMPVERDANWVFRIAESQGRRQWMSGVERFVIICVIVPLHAMVLPIAAAVLGLPVALRMTALQLLVSLTAFEILFYSWQQLPFTCSYAPGRRPLAATLAIWLALLMVVVPALARMIAGLSQFPQVFAVYAAFIVLIWLWARRRRREGWGESHLIYEETPGDVADLGIKELTYGAVEFEARGPAEPPPHEDPAAVTVTLRIYRALARAFPYEFRNTYGEELMQVTEDAIEPIWRRHGVLGLVRLLADIARQVVAEHLAELWHDVRYGLRMLAGSPGFTAVALVSLGLGIGVATCAFSEMNGMVLRDVPGVARPDGLVLLKGPLSYPDYRQYRDRIGVFSSTFAYLAPATFGVSLGGRTERLWGHFVTGSYFATLGVRPILGRTFEGMPEQPGQAPAVVISHRFWQAHLASDAAVIGKTLRINGHPCEIAGVAPKDFLGASPMTYQADLWTPIWTEAGFAPELADNILERRDRAVFHVAGRLQPGVTAAQAEAALEPVARQLERERGEPDSNRGGRRVRLLPGGKVLPIEKKDLPFFAGLFTILGGMILLIASSNVANMMLARAADRRREIAVRLALGASRGRLVRQLLTECLLLAAGAGVLGFLMAMWVMRLASQVKVPYAMPIHFDLEPDGRVLLFTTVLTLFTGLAFGLLPALQATRADLTPALKGGGDVPLRRFRRLGMRNLLVLSQVAGSLALLVLTGFLVLGHMRLGAGETGFDPRNVYLLSLDPVRDGYSGEQSVAFFANLLDRVKGMPAVTSATLTESAPMDMVGRPGLLFSIQGAGPGDGKAIRWARRLVVGKDYFETLGIPILLGRGFRKEDEADGSIAAIVNERVVQQCWKGQDPLGRQIEMGAEDMPAFDIGPAKGGGRLRLSGKTQRFHVVGVTRNVRDGIDAAPKEWPPIIYLPMRPAGYARPGLRGVSLMARARPGHDVLGAVRREISAMDANLTPFRARSMMEQIDELLFPVHAALWTYGCIGVFGLILASVGLAGVTAYSVTRRSREIGIRIALGARSGDVMGLVMKEGVVLVAIGTVMGLAGAQAGTAVLSSLFSQIARTSGTRISDPLLLVGAPALLAGLALLACYIPARKSMRVDPVIALRQE